jgi:hypothetical protein
MGRFKRKQARRLRKQRRQMCPACLDRDAVNLVGKPKVLGGFRLTGGCEVCGGHGEVTVAVLDGDKDYDPFVLRSVA